MTLFIDRREGSADVLPILQARAVPCELIELPYGDAAFFEGRGPEGRTVTVAAEIKALGDAIQCLRDGRFVDNQLVGLTESYDVVWLIIEGIWDGDAEGNLVTLVDKTSEDKKGKSFFGFWSVPRVGIRRAKRRELEGHLLTLIQKVGLGRQFYVWRTRDREDTAQFLATLYRWWTANDWDDHQSHEGIHSGAEMGGAVQLVRATFMQRVANVFPGIGFKKGRDVYRYFGAEKNLSVEDMVGQPPVEWAKVPGIGKGIAEKVVAALKSKGGKWER